MIFSRYLYCKVKEATGLVKVLLNYEELKFLEQFHFYFQKIENEEDYYWVNSQELRARFCNC